MYNNLKRQAKVCGFWKQHAFNISMYLGIRVNYYLEKNNFLGPRVLLKPREANLPQTALWTVSVCPLRHLAGIIT